MQDFKMLECRSKRFCKLLSDVVSVTCVYSEEHSSLYDSHSNNLHACFRMSPEQLRTLSESTSVQRCGAADRMRWPGVQRDDLCPGSTGKPGWRGLFEYVSA